MIENNNISNKAAVGINDHLTLDAQNALLSGKLSGLINPSFESLLSIVSKPNTGLLVPSVTGSDINQINSNTAIAINTNSLKNNIQLDRWATGISPSTASVSSAHSYLSPPTLYNSPIEDQLDIEVLDSVNALLQMKNTQGETEIEIYYQEHKNTTTGAVQGQQAPVRRKSKQQNSSSPYRKDRSSTGNNGQQSLKGVNSPSKRKESSSNATTQKILPNPYQVIRENSSSRRRSSTLGISTDTGDNHSSIAGRMSSGSTNGAPSSPSGPISPSLRHASAWTASKENVDNFSASTALMEATQRSLLSQLLNTFGSKVHNLELIFKPPTKRKPDARWIPKYVFQKCTWVEELWEEWKNGLNGLISLSELEKHWGSEWVLARKEVKHEKFRRMRVIRELKRLMHANGWNESQVLDYIKREVTGKGINARKWGDSLPKNSGTVMDLDQDDMEE